ncbi:MAG: Na/Pi symporter [Crocinitomicaceae bacterium]
MHWSELIFGVIASIGLFIHSLEHFSAKLKDRAGNRIKASVNKFSSNRISGLILGIAATAIIQSSSAVISIVVSFVDSEVLSFANTLPIILGANIGTTLTAWLVSMDIAYLGIILVSIGFILGYFPGKMKFYSKPIFYLGLILFSLKLIGGTLEPLNTSETTKEFLMYASNPFLGVLLGMIISTITQSSSVTVGLAIILAGQGILDLNSAIGILVGANLGTTSTAFIAAIKLNQVAQKTALLNLLVNIFGVLIYLPLHKIYSEMIASIDASIAIQVAYAHLIFNVSLAILLLPFSKSVTKFVDSHFWKSSHSN